MEQSTSEGCPIEPRPPGRVVPLTALQRRGWASLLSQQRLSVRAFILSVRTVGPLATHILQEAISETIKRHEALRTRIVQAEGAPFQDVDTTSKLDLRVVDFGTVSRDEAITAATQLAQTFSEQKIDVSVGPLFDAMLLRLATHEHILVLALDHMIADAISCRILAKEIWGLYAQAIGGRTFSLPELPVQFADYATWQDRTYESWQKKHEAYWKDRLWNAPRAHLPTSCSLTTPSVPTVIVRNIPLGKTLTFELQELARRERTMMPLVVLTLYIAAMSRWCKLRDLVVAFVSHGRHRRPELENVIGPVAGLLHLRIEIQNSWSLTDLLRHATQEFHSAYEHQDYDRVPEIIPGCTTDLYFNWLGGNVTPTPTDQHDPLYGKVQLRPFPLRAAWPQRFLPQFSNSPIGIVFTVRFRPDLFDSRTVEKLSEDLRLLGNAFVHQPLLPIPQIVSSF